MKPATGAYLPMILMAVALATAPFAMGGGSHDEPEPVHIEPGAEADPGIRSPDLAPGESWSYTFAKTGKFEYHCHPHPWMLAGIQVGASSGRAPINYTIEIVEPIGEVFGNWTFTPALTRVEVGDTVTWVNKGTTVHVIQETTAEHADHIGIAGGGDDHGAEGVAQEISPSGSLIMGLPAQGWMWVVAALLGGILIGRRMTKVKQVGGTATKPAPRTTPAAEPSLAPPSSDSPPDGASRP